MKLPGFLDVEFTLVAHGVKRERPPLGFSKMSSDDYPEGYWERGKGSNYYHYGHDSGWVPTLKVMRQFLPGPNPTLIEIACAKGYFVLDARRAGFEASGFDISEYAVNKAPSAVFPEYVSVHNAALPWPYPAGETDVVCAWEFFEHVPEEEIESVLYEVWRALKIGGQMWLRIGFAVPKTHPFWGKKDRDQTHVATHDRRWWESTFRSYGFEQMLEAEVALDRPFVRRDWTGRFFVWKKPNA